MTTAHTAERSHQSPTGDLFDAYLTGCKTMIWTQDQVEALTSSWLHQAKTMRDDGQKVLEVLVSQAKENTEAVKQQYQQALEQVPAWDAMTLGSLRRQIDALSDRVEKLENR